MATRATLKLKTKTASFYLLICDFFNLATAGTIAFNPSPNFCSNLSPHFPITEVTLVPVAKTRFWQVGPDAKTRFWQVEFPKVFSWTLSLLGI